MIEAVCFALGDTLIAEETIIHNSSGQAITAEVVEGVIEVLETIGGGACKAAVVANAHTIEPRNVITICGSEHYFDITIISERLVSRSPPEGYSRPHYQ